MSLPDVAASAIAGLVGSVAWVKLHRHPDLVTRDEWNLILGELRYIRERLDELAKRR